MRGNRNVANRSSPFKDELMGQVEQGLVRPVAPGAVTPFISGVVTMPKDSVPGGVRITVDFRELNKWLVGTIFTNKTPFEAVQFIPTGMNYFKMFDGHWLPYGPTRRRINGLDDVFNTIRPISIIPSPNGDLPRR